MTNTTKTVPMLNCPFCGNDHIELPVQIVHENDIDFNVLICPETGNKFYLIDGSLDKIGELEKKCTSQEFLENGKNEIFELMVKLIDEFDGSDYQQGKKDGLRTALALLGSDEFAKFNRDMPQARRPLIKHEFHGSCCIALQVFGLSSVDAHQNFQDNIDRVHYARRSVITELLEYMTEHKLFNSQFVITTKEHTITEFLDTKYIVDLEITHKEIN